MSVDAIGICTSCKEMKPLAKYKKFAGGKDYFRKHCAACWSKERSGYLKEWSAKNSDRLKEYHRAKYRKNPEQQATNRKRHYEKCKAIVFDHYGWRCSCCGETEQKFLSIDHVNSDGAEHRKQVAPGVTMLRWIARHNFPSSFRVLCFNCNVGRYHNGGICPHEAARVKETKDAI